jgi:hypothetical protein
MDQVINLSLDKNLIWNIFNYMGKWPTMYSLQKSLLDDKS